MTGHKKQYMRVGELADRLGLSVSSIRAYSRAGKITTHRTPGGHRYFIWSEVAADLGLTERKVAFYIRSSSGDATLMKAQYETLQKVHGQPVAVYEDKTSGLKEDRPGLEQAFQGAADGTYTILAVTHHDRLSRFGTSYITRILENHGARVEALNDDRLTPIAELTADFMDLMASFSGRYCRLRRDNDAEWSDAIRGRG